MPKLIKNISMHLLFTKFTLQDDWGEGGLRDKIEQYMDKLEF